MAERFAAGGRLVAFGQSPAARSDARHVAVEFVHPVIVGKRALPAIGIAPEGGPLDAQAGLLVEPDDIAVGFGVGEGADEETVRALALARERGCMTIAFAPCGAEWEFQPPSGDPFVRQELIETLYHVLWELVHVFFDHRGLLCGPRGRQVHDTGASSFLYPFLSESEHDLGSVLADVSRVGHDQGPRSGRAARTDAREMAARLWSPPPSRVRERLERGRPGPGLRQRGFGDRRDGPRRRSPVPSADAGDGTAARWPGRPAIELTEDASIITAVANDIGVEEIFQRQVIAYGREGDVAVAFSTSGGSENLIEALAEARRRGMLTVAFVGYDGGRIAAEGLADHLDPQSLAVHPADPGGAGERLPRAPRADRARI